MLTTCSLPLQICSPPFPTCSAPTCIAFTTSLLTGLWSSWASGQHQQDIRAQESSEPGIESPDSFSAPSPSAGRVPPSRATAPIRGSATPALNMTLSGPVTTCVCPCPFRPREGQRPCPVASPRTVRQLRSVSLNCAHTSVNSSQLSLQSGD